MTVSRLASSAALIACAALSLCLLAALSLGLLAAPTAAAAVDQETIFSDNTHLLADPAGTMARLRLLGVERVRLFLNWSKIAPDPTARRAPTGFNPRDPAAYPTQAWAPWDAIIADASRDGIGIDLDVMGPAPRWAMRRGDTQRGAPHPGWEPYPSAYGAFVRAVATRYSGNWDPVSNTENPLGANDLPAITYWSVWNEPNYGPTLAPQGVPGHYRVEHSPAVYRDLLDQAWSALQRTGHGGDTILWGDLAPRGRPIWGVFSGMKPLVFLRALFCVDSSYRRLAGAPARLRGCPTRPGSAAAFRAAHPALFRATGVALHLYMRWYPPNIERDYDPGYASLAELGGVTGALDHLQAVYGSARRLPIYDTEFGYMTSPPKLHTPAAPYVSPSTAAAYLNWAEYIHWKSPRLRSYDQYLLYDPLPDTALGGFGGYASGLLGYGGQPKATYDAFRLPLYLPHSAQRRGGTLEVWGCLRPGHFATDDTGLSQTVQVQFAPAGGKFATIRELPISSATGYFDTQLSFPASGRVRLRWNYPQDDVELPAGYAIDSRTVAVSVR